MNRLSLGAALALTAAALAALAAIPEPASGCAVVPPEGMSVNTAEEGALVVWDEKTKTEHFVRRAAFQSTAYDFGFLVPTPTRPHLDLADDDLFRELSALTAAKIEYLGEDPSAPISHPPLSSGFDLRVMGVRIPDKADSSATVIASMTMISSDTP